MFLNPLEKTVRDEPHGSFLVDVVGHRTAGKAVEVTGNVLLFGLPELGIAHRTAQVSIVRNLLDNRLLPLLYVPSDGYGVEIVENRRRSALEMPYG